MLGLKATFLNETFPYTVSHIEAALEISTESLTVSLLEPEISTESTSTPDLDVGLNSFDLIKVSFKAILQRKINTLFAGLCWAVLGKTVPSISTAEVILSVLTE